MSGGRINITKAAEVVLHDFRAGILGRITLETPEQFEAWWAEGQAIEEARRLAKEARGKAKKGSRQAAQEKAWLAQEDNDEPDEPEDDTAADQ